MDSRRSRVLRPADGDRTEQPASRSATIVTVLRHVAIPSRGLIREARRTTDAGPVSGAGQIGDPLRYPLTVRFCVALSAVLMLAGCEPAAKPFDPTKPHRYRVLRGDTWQSISSKREVEPEDVRKWNGLRPDHVLIPGQILWVFPGGRGAPDPGEHPAVAAARVLNPDEPPPERPGVAVPAPSASADTEASDDAVAAAPPPSPSPKTPSATTRSAGQEPATVDSPGFGPGGTSLLSLLDEVKQAELEHVPSVQPTGDPMEGILAARRSSLAGGGSVDGTGVEIDRVVKSDPGVAGPGAIPKLPKADAKRCLPARLDQDIGEYDMAQAAGLGRAAIKRGMRPALVALQGCLPGGGKGPHELHVEVSLGCDGLVYDTQIVEDAGLPAPVTGCVEAVVDQASFDAAAGATTFLYPVILGY